MVVYELKDYRTRKNYLLIIISILLVGNSFFIIKGLPLVNPNTFVLIFAIMCYVIFDQIARQYIVTYDNELFEIKALKTFLLKERIYKFNKSDIKSAVTYSYDGYGTTMIEYEDVRIRLPRDVNKDFDKFIDELLNPTVKSLYQVAFKNNHSLKTK